MPKLIGLVLAVALAGAASAAGWRSLRVDASSEAAFEQSLTEFTAELSAARLHVLSEALKDIWVARSQAAEAEQREYTEADFYREIDGLTYEELVNFTDPTGKTARGRYRAAMASAPRPLYAATAPNWGARPPGGWARGTSAGQPGMGN